MDSADPILAQFVPLVRPQLFHIAFIGFLLLVGDLTERDIGDVKHAICLYRRSVCTRIFPYNMEANLRLRVAMIDDVEET